MSKPRLLVVVASTRPGRAGPTIGDWFAAAARQHGGFDVQEVDLADLALPLLDEPNHPRLRLYEHEHTKQWSATVDAADAFVFVTPEYNYGYPASLKNAIDYLHEEWLHKPLGFVSYGGIAGGTRAIQQLRQVAGALMMVVPQNLVNIAWFKQMLDGDDRFVADDAVNAAANAMLDEMLRLHRGLLVVRQAS